MAFAHTPYDGSSRPFSIGLEPLDPARWIEPDERLARDLAEKHRLFATLRDDVVRCEADTRAAQDELLRALTAHLTAQHPAVWRRYGDAIEIVPARTRVALASDDPPIMTAARLVQEDLVLMRRGDAGWRLAAAALCFPSGWSLAEKFGRELAEIHAPVPGYAGRMGAVVARIFDNLRAGAPLVRFNWSIYGDAALRQLPGAGTAMRLSGGAIGAHLRIERQTLTRLPASGDIVFTIRIHVDRIDALARHRNGPALARGLRAQLQALTPDQAAYKGLAGAREELVAQLETIATG